MGRGERGEGRGISRGFAARYGGSAAKTLFRAFALAIPPATQAKRCTTVSVASDQNTIRHGFLNKFVPSLSRYGYGTRKNHWKNPEEPGSNSFPEPSLTRSSGTVPTSDLLLITVEQCFIV